MQLLTEPLSPSLQRECPAKINLRLAVLGKREDGYHDLSSIVAPISLYDRLEAEWLQGDKPDTLSIPNSDLDPGESNLVTRALQAFRAAYPFPGHLKTTLRKAIPSGAGLGGGSSDAAGMLLLLQEMWGDPLKGAELKAIATKLGADVPFFLASTTALMRGIGDELTLLPELHDKLKDAKLFIFKPSFGISTAWAYKALAEHSAYQDASTEEALLSAALAGGSPFKQLPFNAFRHVADRRFPTLPVLLEKLQSSFSVTLEMSGSGSACFTAYTCEEEWQKMEHMVKEAWGETAFCEKVHVV